MSRVRDLAIELFGEEEGANMDAADVYQRMAKKIVRELVDVTHRPSYLIVDEDLIFTRAELQEASGDPFYSAHLGDLVGRHLTGANDSAAYELGYRAQMEDALGEYTESRSRRLDQLAGVYRLLDRIPQPSNAPETQ